MGKKSMVRYLYQIVMDFFKKCNDDHITAFGAMSAFFILLSIFPFMIFFLTLTKYAPYTKDDVINVMVNIFSFERKSLIMSLVNEIYRKTDTSVFTISVIAALWSSSRGVYSIVKGLDSVYDIEDNRNFFVLRFFSMLCTVIFAAMVIATLILWVFGNVLYHYICDKLPMFQSLAQHFIDIRAVVSLIIITVFFMVIYRFVPNRESSFFRQWPGALIASFGWIAVSWVCSLFMDGFTSFSYVYGSMAGIMILLLWLYFCMSMVFYGAEFNYFLENKKNYHYLVLLLRHNKRASQRKRERLRKNKKKEDKNEQQDVQAQ